MPSSEHPTNDFLIVLFFLALCLFGGLSYFRRPADPTTANLIITGLFGAFTGACGAKWGLTQSKPVPGSVTDTATHIVTPVEPGK